MIHPSGFPNLFQDSGPLFIQLLVQKKRQRFKFQARLPVTFINHPARIDYLILKKERM